MSAVIVMRFKPGLRNDLSSHGSIQTCELISHCLEIYTTTWHEYKIMGQTNSIV